MRNQSVCRFSNVSVSCGPDVHSAIAIEISGLGRDDVRAASHSLRAATDRRVRAETWPRGSTARAANPSKTNVAAYFFAGGLLLDGQFRQGVGGFDEPVPVPLDILRRAAFIGDGVGDLRRRQHVDRVPRAPALAQRTADAAIEIDVAERLHARHVLAGHLVDAIDRADFDARLAAGAIVGVDDRQFLGQFLARLGGGGFRGSAAGAAMSNGYLS